MAHCGPAGAAETRQLSEHDLKVVDEESVAAIMIRKVLGVRYYGRGLRMDWCR